MPPKRQREGASSPEGVELKRQKLELPEQPNEQIHRLDTLPREQFELIMSFCDFDDWEPFQSVCRSLRLFWDDSPAGILSTAQVKMHAYFRRTPESLKTQLSYKDYFESTIRDLFSSREDQCQADDEADETARLKAETIEALKDYPHLIPVVEKITKLSSTDEDDYHHHSLIWYGGKIHVVWDVGSVEYLHKTIVTSGTGYPEDNCDMQPADLVQKLGISEADFLLLWNKGFPRSSLWNDYLFEMEYFTDDY